MKKLICVVLIFSLILSLCSCSLTSKNFAVGYIDKIESFNPYKADGDIERIITTNCFEGLLRFNESGKIDPAGAIAYFIDSKNLTYTFTLNPEAIWHIPENLILDNFNNTITADDYIFGLNLLKKSGCSVFDEIKVEAVDNYTLKFTLKKPDTDFLYKLCENPVIPCNKTIYEILGTNFCRDINSTITNGVYCISAINKKGEIILTPCADYKGNLNVKNREITLIPFKNQQELSKNFEKGKLDINLTTTFNRIDNNSLTVTTVKNNVWGVLFNCKNAFFNNKELRLLLLNHLNFDIIKTPAFAQGKAKNIIPGSFFIDEEFYEDFQPEEVTFNKTKADDEVLNKILKSAGRKSFSFKVLVPKQLETSFRKVITEWENAFGERIKFDLVSYKAENSVLATKQGNYDIAVLPLSPENLTPASILNKIISAPCYWKNKNLETLYSSSFGDTEKNAATYKKAEKLIVSEGVFVPLFYSGIQLYQNKNITGFYPSPNGETIYLHSGARI